MFSLRNYFRSDGKKTEVRIVCAMIDLFLLGSLDASRLYGYRWFFKTRKGTSIFHCMPKLKIPVLLLWHFHVNPFLFQGCVTSGKFKVWMVIAYKGILVFIEGFCFQTMMFRLERLLRRGTEVIISPILLFIIRFPLGLDGKFHRSSLESLL